MSTPSPRLTPPAAARLLGAPTWLVRRLCDQYLQVERLGPYREITSEQLPLLKRLLAERGYPRRADHGAA
jgi:hypothetical protein